MSIKSLVKCYVLTNNLQSGDMTRWHRLCGNLTRSHDRRVGIDEMNGRGEGFTLAELMIVLAVISIITVVAITSFRSGLYANYAVSQTARKLIVALQETRMRAFQNERISRVNSVTAVGTESQYQVTLMGTENVFQTVGDYAAFSGLSYPVGMNGGAYYVLAVSTGANAITVAYPGDASSAVTTETPIAKNISQAATLRIRKRVSRDEGPPGHGEFVYDSERMGIWIEGDYSPFPGGGTEPDPRPIAFNSRGFAADPNGYRIIIARKRPGTSEFYYKDGTTVTNALVVTVSPFGMVKSGY